MAYSSKLSFHEIIGKYERLNSKRQNTDLDQDIIQTSYVFWLVFYVKL